MIKFRLIGITFALLALIGLSSCEDDDVDNEAIIGPGTVDTRINTTGSLSSLEAALGVASGDIASTLNGTGPFTVFAPNDAAFTALAETLGFEGTDDITPAEDLLANVDSDLLAQILTYHVVPENLEASSLSDGSILTTVQGGSLSTVVTDDDIQLLDASDLPETNPVSNIIQSNIFADNGIVHIIDKILLPQDAIDALNFDTRPSVLEWATGTDNLSSLAAALDKAGLVDAVTALDTARVLAPNNQAFEDFFDTLGDNYSDLEDFDNDAEIALLQNTLWYHILPPVDESIDLSAGARETLLEDNTVDVIASGSSFEFGDATATMASILTGDIDANNGAVDIIDNVLLPQVALDFLALLASDDLATTVVDNGSLTILEEALIATDLLGDFIDETNVAFDSTATNFTYFRTATVFAPTDAAFNDLFDALGTDYTNIASFDTEDELELLSELLLYHVISGQMASEDLEAGIVTTAAERDIEIISVLGTDDFVIGDATNDINANISTPDVFARNGIAHVIDKVLLPQSVIDFIDSLDD
ncbi:MAG: fasciclin domain-containing protein [Flavobacteriaceae bacterium]